jgi:hypothetical protein
VRRAASDISPSRKRSDRDTRFERLCAIRRRPDDGDIVWFEPGERHWHGALPTTAMSHIEIAEMLDGQVVEWMECVTDEQYGG